MVRRIRSLTLVAAVVAAGTLALHAASQPPAPGRSFSWASTATTPSPPAQAVLSPASTPAPSADSGPLGAVVPPFAALLQHLNGETQTVAEGQYSILEQLEHALRDRVDQFLNWVTGRR